MAKRKIIRIDAEKCNGCALCIPNCPEGALQVIDGKARLISDLFCDGLGACIGHCPQGAITIEEREAQEYDERQVMQNIIKQGQNVIKAHLEHLREHGQKELLDEAVAFIHGPSLPKHTEHTWSCPGLKIIDFRKAQGPREPEEVISRGASQLRQWPIQITLVPPHAPYLKDAHLLIAADCVPFAYADFHPTLLKGKILLVGCPKLDDLRLYQEKISQILKHNRIKFITYAHMEVPCCFGLVSVIKEAISESGKELPFKEVIISIRGEKINELPVSGSG